MFLHTRALTLLVRTAATATTYHHHRHRHHHRHHHHDDPIQAPPCDGSQSDNAPRISWIKVSRPPRLKQKVTRTVSRGNSHRGANNSRLDRLQRLLVVRWAVSVTDDNTAPPSHSPAPAVKPVEKAYCVFLAPVGHSAFVPVSWSLPSLHAGPSAASRAPSSTLDLLLGPREELHHGRPPARPLPLSRPPCA